jgi:hypothetical protein
MSIMRALVQLLYPVPRVPRAALGCGLISGRRGGTAGLLPLSTSRLQVNVYLWVEVITIGRS